MRILFIFTGGTIGSKKERGIMSVHRGASYDIIDAYERRYGIDFEYSVTEPYTELSENNTGAHIKRLCQCVKDSLESGYDGIIVTHGSDTLQYSAAALGYCVGLRTLPICMVAACAPIEAADSNALDNLRAAVRFIELRAGGGVFAVYRNSASGTVSVHRGTRLIGGKAYSDELSSACEAVYGKLDTHLEFTKNPRYRESPDELLPFDGGVLSENNGEALVLFSYPAMVYPEIGEGVRYVIFNTYHSGTLNTRSAAAREFFLSAKSRGIPVYATGASRELIYSSAALFSELGITPVYGLSPVAAYIKLWLARSSGKDLGAVLGASLSGDLLPS